MALEAVLEIAEEIWNMYGQVGDIKDYIAWAWSGLQKYFPTELVEEMSDSLKIGYNLPNNWNTFPVIDIGKPCGN